MNSNWIDISVPLRSGMPHWPDNPPVKIERLFEIERGAAANVSVMSMGAHTGTHMDGLLHFIRDGKPLDQMPLDAAIGPCRVLEVSDKVCIRPEHLEPHQIKAGERILFKTLNSVRSWKTDEFDEDFVYISKEAAQHLVDHQVQTVGVDYLSVGGFKRDGVETHMILLGAGVWVIEGLNLSQIQPGHYELICLPVRVQNSDGAPARAILRPLPR
jgi:arylformamidase